MNVRKWDRLSSWLLFPFLLLNKLYHETYVHWDQLLPVVLLEIMSSPTKQTGFSLYKILCGPPPPIRGDLKKLGNLTMRQQMQTLSSTLSTLHQWVRELLPVSLITDPQPFKPGDAIWVKEWNVQPLKPPWRGPFTVILSTLTAVKVTEVAPWNLQQSKASSMRLGVYPWSLNTMQVDHLKETSCSFRDLWGLQPCSSYSGGRLAYA